MKNVLVLFVGLFLISSVFAQEVLYEEHFTDGGMELEWFTPWEEGADIFIPTFDESTPAGDSWVGSLSKDNTEGPVGTALSGTLDMTDYKIEAWIYFKVGDYTRNGIVARFDTTGGMAMNQYYYVYSNFTSGMGTTMLQFRIYQGGAGVDLLTWDDDTLPGGIPTEDEWHKIALECTGNEFNVYWDDELLPGCPYTDNSLTNGFFGAYVMNFMGPGSTLADDIIITSPEEAVGADTPAALPVLASIVSTYPNPFNPTATIMVDSPGTVSASLSVFDLLGRKVADLAQGKLTSGRSSFVFQAGNLPAGTYFVILETPDVRDVQRIVLMK